MPRDLAVVLSPLLALSLLAACGSEATVDIPSSTEAAANGSDDEKEETAADRAARHFEQTGAVAGKVLATHSVQGLDGRTTDLADLWRDKPTLLVTASVTCPVARKRYPSLAKIAERFGDRINVAVVYTLEAHPQTDPSPYSNYRGEDDPSLEWTPPGSAEWQTKVNQEEDIFHRQPEDLDGRAELAREFESMLEVEVPILLDDMDNSVWAALGEGPNVGVLVRPGGEVYAKHGWFDGATMEQSIEYLLSESR